MKIVNALFNPMLIIKEDKNRVVGKKIMERNECHYHHKKSFEIGDAFGRNR